jgi:predicted ATPase
MQSLYFRSEALSQAIENPFALAIHASLCAGAFMGAGDRATCKVLADMAVEISREHGYPFWLGTGLVLRGWALGQEGAADAGLASIDEGIATFEATNARVQLANWYGIKAETLAAAGRPEDGLAAVRHALDVAEVTGDVWFVPRIHAVAARLQRRIGNREATAHHECEVASLVESNGLAPAFVTVADPRR